jgi:hypothetical protein
VVEEDLHALLFASGRTAVIALGDDLHHVILRYRPVETVSECLAYDRTAVIMMNAIRKHHYQYPEVIGCLLL